MPSPEYLRFLASMHIGYMEWHDGTGYDLEALQSLCPEEKQQAESLLSNRLSSFRDLEALDCLGTESALASMESAVQVHRRGSRLGPRRPS